MAESRGIWIISEVDREDEGSKGVTRSGRGTQWEAEEKPLKRGRVSAETLKGNMEEFFSVLEEALDHADQSQSRIRLEEVELVVEITAEGQVGLLGNGGKLGGKGSMLLKFKRVSL